MIPYEFGEVNITTNPNPKLSLGTIYKPEYIPVKVLFSETTIDKSTIYKWCRQGNIRYLSNTGKPCNTMKVRVKDFVDYVLKYYRYPLNGIVGKRWSKLELDNVENCNRTQAAKKIKRLRLEGRTL